MEIKNVLSSIQKAAAFDVELSKLQNKEVFMPAINKVAAAELKKMVEDYVLGEDHKDLKFAKAKVAVDEMIMKKALKWDMNTLLRANKGKQDILQEAEQALIERTRQVKGIRQDLITAQRQKVVQDLQKIRAQIELDRLVQQDVDYVKSLQASAGHKKNQVTVNIAKMKMPHVDSSKIQIPNSEIEQELQPYLDSIRDYTTPDTLGYDLRKVLRDKGLTSFSATGNMNPLDEWQREKLVESGSLRKKNTPISHYPNIANMFDRPGTAIEDLLALNHAGELGSYPAKWIVGAGLGIPLGIAGVAAVGDEVANALTPAGGLVSQKGGVDPSDYALASAIGAGGSLGAYQLASLAGKGKLDTDILRNLQVGAGGAALGAVGNAWYRNDTSPLDMWGRDKNASLHALDTLFSKRAWNTAGGGSGLLAQQVPPSTGTFNRAGQMGMKKFNKVTPGQPAPVQPAAPAVVAPAAPAVAPAPAPAPATPAPAQAPAAAAAPAERIGSEVASREGTAAAEKGGGKMLASLSRFAKGRVGALAGGLALGAGLTYGLRGEGNART